MTTQEQQTQQFIDVLEQMRWEIRNTLMVAAAPCWIESVTDADVMLFVPGTI